MTMVRGLRIHDRIARSVYDGESMHIVIATVGTRGDAQPYVALGKVLSARSHRVTLATHEDHRELAESNGLGFRSVGASDPRLTARAAAIGSAIRAESGAERAADRILRHVAARLDTRSGD